MSNNPKNHEPQENQGEILVYRNEDGQVKLDVRLQDETVWLTQQQVAELLQTSVPNVSMHIRNIYEEEELTPEATLKKFLTVRREGNRDVKRELDFYNLDMIISVGYRVKSIIATRFRIWATERLKEYIVKGFTIGWILPRIRPNGASRCLCRTGSTSWISSWSLTTFKFQIRNKERTAC